MAKKNKPKTDAFDIVLETAEKVKKLQIAVGNLGEKVNKIEPHIHNHDIKVACPICAAEFKIDIPRVKFIKDED